MKKIDDILSKNEYLPDIDIFEYVANNDKKGSNSYKISDLAYKKNVVIVSVIGAFIPVCSNHILEYVDLYKKFTQTGINEIWCLSINDPFVMNAWKLSLKIKNMRFLCDTNNELTESLNLTLDLSIKGLGIRSNYGTILVESGKIIDIITENNLGVFINTKASNILKKLQNYSFT